MQENNFDRVQKRIDTYSEQVIAMQRKLVSIPALAPESGGEGEIEKARYVKTLLEELGFDEIKEFNAADDRVPSGIRPNILAKIYGRDRERTIWVMAHLDVVPPGDEHLWGSSPFELVVDGDKLIGRGTEDNHQGLVSASVAVRALREEGITPACNVGFAIVSDEETGSQYGLLHVLKHHRDEFGPDDLVLVPDAGDSEGRTIEVAEKGILWVRFHTKGKQCHASTPELGVNAHRAGANLIVKLDELNRIFDARDEMFDPPISTFEPTKKEGNIPNVNTIPGEDVFYMDARVLPQYPLSEVETKIRGMIEEVERTFRVKIDMTFPQRAEAAPPTPPDAPVVLALKRAIKRVKGIEPEIIGIGGGTVAAIFREAGLPAAVWSTFEDTAHQPNEYSLISNTLMDAKVLAHVFMEKP